MRGDSSARFRQAPSRGKWCAHTEGSRDRRPALLESGIANEDAWSVGLAAGAGSGLRRAAPSMKPDVLSASSGQEQQVLVALRRSFTPPRRSPSGRRQCPMILADPARSPGAENSWPRNSPRAVRLGFGASFRPGFNPPFKLILIGACIWRAIGVPRRRRGYVVLIIESARRVCRWPALWRAPGSIPVRLTSPWARLRPIGGPRW